MPNVDQKDILRAIHTVMDTWGKHCSQMIMFGNVPDIKVDNIPFVAIKDDHADSWKSLSQVFTKVIAFLSYQMFEVCYFLAPEIMMLN